MDDRLEKIAKSLRAARTIIQRSAPRCRLCNAIGSYRCIRFASMEWDGHLCERHKHESNGQRISAVSYATDIASALDPSIDEELAALDAYIADLLRIASAPRE